MKPGPVGLFGRRSYIDRAAQHIRDCALATSTDVPSLAGELFMLTGTEGSTYVYSLQRDVAKYSNDVVIRTAATALEQIGQLLETIETSGNQRQEK